MDRAVKIISDFVREGYRYDGHDNSGFTKGDVLGDESFDFENFEYMVVSISLKKRIERDDAS